MDFMFYILHGLYVLAWTLSVDLAWTLCSVSKITNQMTARKGGMCCALPHPYDHTQTLSAPLLAGPAFCARGRPLPVHRWQQAGSAEGQALCHARAAAAVEEGVRGAWAAAGAQDRAW